MDTINIESQFLPSTSYFSALKDYTILQIDNQRGYQKKSYLNRCFILTSQGKHRVTVPLKKNSKTKGVETILIDYSWSWQKKFWRTIVSAYGKSPFFEYYQDDLKSKIFCGEKFIYNFNNLLLTMCLNWLNMDSKIIEKQNKFVKTPNNQLNSFILSDEETNNLEQYQQVFGTRFVPNLSVIDLIFCQGPNSYQYL